MKHKHRAFTSQTGKQKYKGKSFTTKLLGCLFF